MSSIPSAIIAEAQRQGIDPALALEVAQVESSMNQNARGSHGEVGVFQLMPSTAAGLGVDPYDLAGNIQGGVSYLRQLISMFGDLRAALAANNWGMGNVQNAIQANGSDPIIINGVSIPAWFASIPPIVQSYANNILQNVATQYSVVSAYAGATSGATSGASPGGSTSALVLSSGTQGSGGLQVPPSPTTPFSWGTVALVAGIIFGMSMVLNEL